MKKRFTDCDIWNDPWFRKLSPMHKEFWRFLCERCDAAGVWKIDMEGASFFLGAELSEESALLALNNGKERVKKLDHDRWMLTGFIEFQYGTLSPACRPHIPVLALIKSHGITLSKGYTKAIHSLEDKEEEQEKEQEEEKDSSIKSKKILVRPTIEDVKAYCQERKNSVSADRWFAYYESNGWRVGKNPMKDWKAAVRTWENNGYDKPRSGLLPAKGKYDHLTETV